MTEAVEERVSGYLDVVQTKINDYWKAYGFTHASPPLAAVLFKTKYAKVIYRDDGGRGNQDTVHSFVDLSNGDIIKGTWNAPIRTKKGLAIRGNIFAEDFGADRINNHGPKYLR